MKQNENDIMLKNLENERGIIEIKRTFVNEECKNTTPIKRWQTKEYLEYEYITLKHTIKEIAKSNGVHSRKITQMFHNFGILVRTPAEICNGNKPMDYSGVRFGRLVALTRINFGKKESFWECRCDCGNTKVVRTRSLIAGHCRSCGCITKDKGDKNKCGDMPSIYFRNIIHNAKTRNIQFNLQPIYIWELFLKQNRKCILSGVDIDFHNKTASLDRINSSIGYIDGNVRWVHKIINQMKWNLSDEEFMNWIKVIYRHKNNFILPSKNNQNNIDCIGISVPQYIPPDKNIIWCE